MRRKQTAALLVLIGAGIGAAHAPVRAGDLVSKRKSIVRYAVTDLGVLPGFEHGIIATGINNRGQIVGTAIDDANHARAFLWEKGQMRDLNAAPGHWDWRAAAINDAGQIVGTAFDQKVQPGHAAAQTLWLWEKGQARILYAPPTPTYIYVKGINKSGRIAAEVNRDYGMYGYISDGGPMRELFQGDLGAINDNNELAVWIGSQHPHTSGADWGTPKSKLPPRDFGGLLWKDGRKTIFNIESSSFGYSSPLLLNDRGDVAGSDGGNYYFIPKGKPARIIAKNIHGLRLIGMNDQGQIVGNDSGNGNAAVLLEEGRELNLNRLIPTSFAWHLSAAGGINARGQIICNANGPLIVNGQQKYVSRAFLLIPVKPQTVAP